LPRFHVDLPLVPGLEATLPSAVARHVQVLRLQPGARITLFDGGGAEWPAEVLAMGRSEVRVRVGPAQPVDTELPLAVTLAVGMPANERMDWLVEKATELGVAQIQPLVCERSVLRLDGERAERRCAHWRAVAAAAAEQCGRARLPLVHMPRRLDAWLGGPTPGATPRFVLSLEADARSLATALGARLAPGSELLFLSGPEGGLAPAEEQAARQAGWVPVSLGARVLRAETAAIAALVTVGAHAEQAPAHGPAR
jgi:16S rRNA (uracil1498-N3)-methyltransferase